MKIFVDMDGVLTDFEAQAAKLFGVSRDEVQSCLDKSPGRTWAKIARAGEIFWRNMPWMPDGKQLWEGLAIHKPTILSSPAKHPSSKVGKSRWVGKNLSEDLRIFLESDKAKYAEKDAILIDDREKNTKAWEKAGGIAILHKNARDTLDKLGEILSKMKTAAIRVDPDSPEEKVQLGKMRGGRGTGIVPPKKGGKYTKKQRRREKYWQDYVGCRVASANTLRRLAYQLLQDTPEV